MKKKNWKTYLGSGKILKRAISKYGRKSFSREIISYYDNLENVISAEKNFILENSCHLRDDWYNIAVSFTTQGFKGKKQSEYHKEVMQTLLTGVKRSKESIRKQKKTRLERANDYSYQNHSPEQRLAASKVGKSNKGRKHLKKLCEHCGNHYGPAPFARFHGNNCKQKPT